MIVLTDINGIIYSAFRGGLPDFSATDFCGAYEIADEFSANGCIGKAISDYPILSTITEQPGTHDELPDLKSRRSQEINRECRAEILSGFDSNALGAVHRYPFREEDQSNLTATFLLAKEQGVSKPFKCWDSAGVSEYRMHTVAQLQQVGADAEAHKMAALMKANTKKNEIAAATSVAEVEAITW